MGETNGKKGVWAYVRGGMGGISQAIAGAAKDLGVDIRCNAEVAKIVVRRRQAVLPAWALTSGEEFVAGKVASGVDPALDLREISGPQGAARGFSTAVKHIGYEKLPRSRSTSPCRSRRTSPPCQGLASGRSITAPCTFAPIRISSSAGTTTPSTACRRAIRSSNARCRRRLDRDGRAPPGRHLMSMFVQYAPYKLKNGTWDEETKNKFADRCFEIVNQYAPNFKQSVLARQVISPLDLEMTFGLTGGNIFQGAMNLNQLFLLRPVIGYSNYRTPIRNLYMCGSAAHPGGGVMGIAGQNAAREMLKRW